MPNKTKKRSKFLSLFCVLVLIIGIFAVLFAREIRDVMVGLRYQPSSEMSQVSDHIALTWRAKMILRATRPELETADDFNAHCVDDTDSLSVLGCYLIDSDQIYIYKIDGNDFDGIHESVLAHELLHAVYDRLNAYQKTELNAELDSFYAAHTDDFSEYIANYSTEHRYTELHSIIGQRYLAKDLTPYLKTHYAKYFINQNIIADYYSSYHERFDSKNNEILEAYQELERMDQELNARRDKYQANLEQYNSDVEDHNTQTKLGNWSQSRYDSLLRREKEIDNERNALNQYINEYNVKVREYNQLLADLRQLYDKIDSRYKTKNEAQDQLE